MSDDRHHDHKERNERLQRAERAWTEEIEAAVRAVVAAKLGPAHASKIETVMAELQRKFVEEITPNALKVEWKTIVFAAAEVYIEARSFVEESWEELCKQCAFWARSNRLPDYAGGDIATQAVIKFLRKIAPEMPSNRWKGALFLTAKRVASDEGRAFRKLSSFDESIEAQSSRSHQDQKRKATLIAEAQAEVQKLKPRQKAIIVERLTGKTDEEIAISLNLKSEDAVRKMRNRTEAKIRKALGLPQIKPRKK